MSAAFQTDAFQNNGFQSIEGTLPAFQANAFQTNAFQAEATAPPAEPPQIGGGNLLWIESFPHKDGRLEREDAEFLILLN